MKSKLLRRVKAMPVIGLHGKILHFVIIGLLITNAGIAQFSQNSDLSNAKQFKSSTSQPEQTSAMMQITITGKVVSEEDKEGLPGVNVLVKGTFTGTVTDLNGDYSIEVPSTDATLVFSSVGFNTTEVLVGNQSVINISMSSDVRSLQEIVVTALGIEKDSKTLGYATSNVQSEELTINRSPNMMNALQGKIAGVNISSMGTGPGGTSKIRIRGQSSISGQNNPLIVVNGVPIDNTNFGSKQGNSASDGGLGSTGNGDFSDGGDGLDKYKPG